MATEPTIKYAMAFVDGQNLFQHAMDAFGHYHPNYDVKKLHETVCAEHGWRPNLVRFYTGVPSKRKDAMWGGYGEKRLLHMKRAGIHTVTRPLRYRETTEKDEAGNLITITTPQEKGIDVRLALDIVSTARSRQWDVAVIFSQDQDLAEVVQEVRAISKEQDRWMEICCPFPSGQNATSKRGIDKTLWFQMDEAFYNNCLDPNDYRPKL